MGTTLLCPYAAGDRNTMPSGQLRVERSNQLKVKPKTQMGSKFIISRIANFSGMKIIIYNLITLDYRIQFKVKKPFSSERKSGTLVYHFNLIMTVEFL